MQPQDTTTDHQGQTEVDWRQEMLRHVAAYRSGLEPGIPAEELLGHLQ